MSIKLIFSGRTHKENESINDCQDYFQANHENNCFAIADGTSQSFYPSIWAELLVNHFCQNPDINKGNWADWLQPIQKKWFQEVEQRVIKAKNENRPIWVTSQNRFTFGEPAASTFIGLQFVQHQVKVSIVGDSCLFIVEGDQSNKKYQLIQTYLLKKSKDFSDSPGYFASYNKDNNFTPHDFKIPLDQKKSPTNIYFILATDALSEYIFKCTENENNIFETLLDISSQEIFKDFVASARNSDNIKMKNDDVTLLILSIPNTSIDQSSLQSRHEIQENAKVSPVSSNEEYGKGNKSSLQSRNEIEGNTRVSLSLTNQQLSKKNKSISNFIFHIFRLLKSDVKFPNLTQKNIPKVQISYDELVSISENLRKENTKLKYHRLGLGICLFVISLLFGILINRKQENIIPSEQPANTNSNQAKTKATPVSTEKHKLTLKKGISVYKDQNFTNVLVNSLPNSSEVEIIEEGDKWTKFKKEIYIYKTLITDNCNDCKGDEIETITADQAINLRLLPDPQGTIFAQLKDKSKFKKLDIKLDWYKFEFVGYVKK
jgi:serine/threonine protein phosphatase PrpC